MFPRCVHEGVRRGMGCRAWTTGEADERSQVVPRTPKLESDLRPTCATGRARMAEEAKPKHKRTSAGKHVFCFSERVFFFSGTCRVLRTLFRECRAYVFLALPVCGAHLPIRAQAGSDAPRASVRSATVELKHVGRTCVPRVLRSPVLCVARG